MKTICRIQALAAIVMALTFATASVPADGGTVRESARELPVAYDVDVVVVGGSTGAVAAAVSAAEAGASVFLAAPYPYLGDDMTATLRMWLEEDETSEHPLAKRIFGAHASPAPVAAAMPRPMDVKKALDEALLEAGVEYLYSSMVTDVLRDAEGEPAGIVISNRAGRQAVVAKTIIDATSRSQVARMAGAAFSEYPEGVYTFRRTVIGGEPRENDAMEARLVEPPFRRGDNTFNVIEYTLELPMDGAGYASWMKAEQKARTMTYHPDQEWASDVLFQTPPDSMESQEAVDGPWPGAEELPLGALKPKGVRGMYVLGGCAGVPREQVKYLLRPLALIDLGARVGAAAAEEASAMDDLEGVRLPGEENDSPVVAGDVREELSGPRSVDSSQLPRLVQDARAVPVLGEYDVVVIGGGTSGAPAGIAAARQGANVLVVEYLHGLGGVGTEGAITRDWRGNRVGFAGTVMNGARGWRVEQKKEWWRRELLDAGAEIWFGSIGAGAFVDGTQVRGAVVVTPSQRGVVLADVVIDATGNSDVAAAAGARTDYTDTSKVAMQGTGLPGRELSGSYNNTDFTITDETDMVDVWHMFVHSKHKYPNAFDHGRLIDTRERRRIMGDFRITLSDQFMGRTYPDTVVQSITDFDSHGYTIDPYVLIAVLGRQHISTNIPYRSMLPCGLEGMLVVGLSISAHRDAVPLIRMQPDIENGGYVAGVAASMAVDSGVGPRDIDVRELQRHLVGQGNLPEEVLEHEDSYPMPAERIAKAVDAILEEGNIDGAAIVLAHAEQALPMVREAYESTAGDAKVTYAKALAILGDASGLDTMLEELQAATEWDDGWNYRGSGQFGRCQSELDDLIIAIGKTRAERAIPAILEKVEMLSAEEAFSHHRAVARALELIGDERAAEPLAELLAKPGMAGNHHPDIQTAIKRERPGGTSAETTRRESLRELLLARALYRCGDHDAVGREILNNYTTDLRGHLARHAKAVLEEER